MFSTSKVAKEEFITLQKNSELKLFRNISMFICSPVHLLNGK